MTAPLYSREILRLAASIPHLGRLQDAHGSAEKRSPICGSTVAVDVRVDENGRILALGQAVRACAFGQAAAALMGAHAIGRDACELTAARTALADYLGNKRDDPGDWPGFVVFDRVRAHSARHAAILLPFDAAIAASRSGRAA